MPWVKLDDGFAEHPKIEAVGPQAAWLHVAALCYSVRNLTDGRIPKPVVPRLATVNNSKQLAGRLVAANLWHDEGDHYRIHDYLDYQPSRHTVAEDKRREREKKARQRAAGMATRNENGTFAGVRPPGSPSGTEGGSPPGNPQGSPPGSPSVPIPTHPHGLKGGGNVRAAASTAPPPRCPEHLVTAGPAPPCGNCAEARRVRAAWDQTHPGPVPDPFAEQRRAEKVRALNGTEKVREILAEEPDPNAAERAHQLREQLRHPAARRLET